MMGPDITHWHGTYEVAKHFYSEFVPDLQDLAEQNANSDDPKKKEAAAKLSAKLDEVLNSDNHKWYLNKMDPAKLKERKQKQDEFKARYEKK